MTTPTLTRETLKLDSNQPQQKGVNALMLAVACGHVEVAKILLENPKQDINERNKVYQYNTSHVLQSCINNLCFILDDYSLV
jgi:ankyrin repeat protein